MGKKVFSVVMALILVLGLSANIFADTIRLKNGSVIKGQVVGFNDQQFIVLITSSRGRQSKMMIYMEDVESIEFDSAKNAQNAPTYDDNNSNNNPTNTQPTNNSPSNVNTSYPPTTNDNNSNQPKNSGYIPIKTVKVLADNTNNGWTSSGYVVRRGQKIRITTTGRIGLGGGKYSSPGGISTLPDKDKLMRNESTGGLIAVIGDDNNDFIFLGARREFRADRDGILFLGVNEGNLDDNTGFYEAVIEIEDNP
jgi:small nuclear ribonucleoprotein (snRNP)-like protein